MNSESAYPALMLCDEELLKELMLLLGKSVDKLADPYSEDGSYAASIGKLPVGLRAMAATHHLDISLTMDDIGWHFLNFGEPNLVRETESGLRELGLVEMASLFAEACAIVNPMRSEIHSGDDYYEVVTQHGKMDRIRELTDKAQPAGDKSLIYDAWVKYAREHPERIWLREN